jgi:putative MFS transporter
LMVDPREIQLPAVAPPVEPLAWRELFKYPRSVAAGCLAGLSGTGITGFLLWQVTLFVMVLHVTPAQASGLVVWLSLGQIVGRFFCSWISDAMGRRASIALTCTIAGVTMSLAGYWNDRFLGGFSVFYLMIMVQQFFGSGSYSIIGPYMAEIWPSRLRASGLGLAYGAGNLGKFIGPAGLAVIAGSSNFVSPQATADALIPAMNYFAAWYVLALVAVLFIGFETRGRTIDEIDSALTAKGPAAAPVKASAV